jgi:hypothetical protein
MEDDWTLPDWDVDSPGTRAAIDARLAEMVCQHLDESPLWPTTLSGLADDLVESEQVRAALARVCVVISNAMVYMHGGTAEAIAALQSDVEQLQRIAARGAEQ